MKTWKSAILPKTKIKLKYFTPVLCPKYLKLHLDEAELKLSFLSDEMDCGVEQIDGPARTTSPSCEQRDAGREGQGDADSRQRGDIGRPRIKLPQRSDMICGFASLKGQRICKFVLFFAILGCNSFFEE